MPNYFSIPHAVLSSYWKVIEAATKGVKPLRGYESFVLIEASVAEQSLTLRVSNEAGGVKVVIEPVEGHSEVLIERDCALAVLTIDLSTVLPFLGSGRIRVADSPEKGSMLVFSGDKIMQHVAWVPAIVEDFPVDNLFNMPAWATFTCKDFDRKLRLASGSATDDVKQANTFQRAMHFEVRDGMVVMQSAMDMRGCSQVALAPPDLWRREDALDAIIPMEAVGTIERAFSASIGETGGKVTVSGDAGGGMLSFSFGRTTYLTRILAGTYYSLTHVFAPDAPHIAEASVPAKELRAILGLIEATTNPNMRAGATLEMRSDGTVFVSSHTTKAPSEATLSGMCSGELPCRMTMNARQVSEILADLRGELVHLGYRGIVKKSPALDLTTPSDTDFLHVANLMVVPGRA